MEYWKRGLRTQQKKSVLYQSVDDLPLGSVEPTTHSMEASVLLPRQHAVSDFGDLAEALVSVFPTSAVCCACPLVFPGSINAVIQRGMRRCGISDTSLPELDAQPLASHAEPGKVR